ncbi:MAG: 16S rRNA (cytosine(1402)-N(4))-methyltransferase RsmH [Eubacterium sp.]|nr:16S rRNA (cytosine(1402)-N(4))-methyltransferase RsmH [Eubacterium sp.]
MEFSHVTVLLKETVDALNIKPDGIYVDGTLGGGGHSERICQSLGKDGVLIGIDQDDFALDYAAKRLAPYTCTKHLVKNNFVNLEAVLQSLDISAIDGIIYDLGVSSFQFDDERRGFSYHNDGPLDMRMNQSAALSAYEVVNDYPPEKLKKILQVYGEERHAARIVAAILRHREERPIETTLALAEIIKEAYPAKERFKEKHPARKSFQAIRLEVNHELDILEKAFGAGIEALKPGGRLGVITFHSLEDRIAKNFFREQANPCTCPPDFPKCVCGKTPRIKLVTRKPLAPSPEEVACNRRARSAKLRVVEKI